LRHLADIGAGRCTITDQVIIDEPDADMRQVLVGLLVLHEDLSYERSLRERSLEQRRLAIAARDDFLAVASHELRTPITTLMLQIDFMADKLRNPANAAPPANDALTRLMPTLRRQVDRLAALIHEMLDVSRITTGHLQLQPSVVDLSALTAEVVGRFELELARQGVCVAIDSDGPVCGNWDAERLDQVVTNLLSNAIKYGRGLPIDIAVGHEGSRARLSVRDRGIGISAADQQRIFAPFARAVSSRHYGGLGLGLWITRKIVDASGGTIAVDSHPDQGSTFTVDLPMV
jgi:signal transduction histidine kinase